MDDRLWILFFSSIAIYCCVVDSLNFEHKRKIERYRRAACDYTKVRSYKKHRNGTIVHSHYRRKPGRRKDKLRK